jgi:hemerythrin-like domain-containing protein
MVILDNECKQGDWSMVLPIGPLMIEHRLIERMIDVIAKEIIRIEKELRVDPSFIDTVVDFIRIYADKCHHGKEEDILFRELEKKDLKKVDRKVMEELIEEHKRGRKVTRDLHTAKTLYLDGNQTALANIIYLLKELIEFYPKHIEKEDNVFFKPSMYYFTEEEKEAMLQEEYEFDRNFIHQVYDEIVSEAEKKD